MKPNTRFVARTEYHATCPECEDEGPHDDNGFTDDRRSFCCRKCGTHFDEVEPQ